MVCGDPCALPPMVKDRGGMVDARCGEAGAGHCIHRRLAGIFDFRLFLPYFLCVPAFRRSGVPAI